MNLRDEIYDIISDEILEAMIGGDYNTGRATGKIIQLISNLPDEIILKMCKAYCFADPCVECAEAGACIYFDEHSPGQELEIEAMRKTLRAGFSDDA